MLRVTIELVPYGMEALAKTISEICIENVSGDKEANIGNYEIAGYEIEDGKIQEFATEVKSFNRNDGALALVREILSTERSKFEKIELAEKLLQHTRLLAGELETNEE